MSFMLGIEHLLNKNSLSLYIYLKINEKDSIKHFINKGSTLIVPDSFLRSRSSNDHEATLMMKTQFMSLWDGLITDPHCQVIIMGATNRPQDVDAAIIRRMPCTFKIGMPVS